MQYGCDFPGGNGKDLAMQVVAKYGNPQSTTPGGYWFTLSSNPSGGAVFSTAPTATNPYGHTGWVEQVEGEYMWYTDGNIGSNKGVRVNNKMLIKDFNARRTWVKYAVPHDTTAVSQQR